MQGKYGYIEPTTGELKVIEYGADMMGFQPQGDLPEGIIIPPPVFNNLTDDQGNPVDYDDGEVERPDLDAHRVRVQNRARTANKFLGGRTEARPKIAAPVARGRPSEEPDQRRGQELEQPVTPRPLGRAPIAPQQARSQVRPPPPPPAQARPQLDQSRFQTNFVSRPLHEPTEPTPAASRPVRPPAVAQDTRQFARPPVRSRQRQPASHPAPARRPAPTSTPAFDPSRVIDPSPGGIPSDPLAVLRAIAGPNGAVRQGAAPTSSRSRAPSRSRARVPSPQAAAPTRAERPRSSVSNAQPTGNRFSSFPARGSSSSSSSSLSRRPPPSPVRASAASIQSEEPRRPIRIRPRPEPVSAPAPQRPRQPAPPPPVPVSQRPQFEAQQVQFDSQLFEPQQPRVPQILPPRPQSRPRFNQNTAALPPTNAVDFDALIQEFTGGRTSFPQIQPRPQQQQQQQSAAPQRFAPPPGSSASFQAVPAVPGVTNANGASFTFSTGGARR